jgi:trehalose-6-phosphatase
MKRQHEGESGCSTQEKKSALSLHARLAKEREQRETQARAHREKMDREKRLVEEFEAKEVLELYASQAARHWL